MSEKERLFLMLFLWFMIRATMNVEHPTIYLILGIIMGVLFVHGGGKSDG